MFKSSAFPDTPLEHSMMRDFMRANVGLTPAADSLTLNSASVAVAATLATYQTTLLSSVAAALFDLPNGEWVGQRKHLVADVSGAGTCVASAAALAKVKRLLMSGETASAAASAIILAADGKFITLEWTGAFWNVLYADASTLTF